jgi:hypothetical protein
VRLTAEASGPITVLNGLAFEVPHAFRRALGTGRRSQALATLIEDPRSIYLDFLIRRSRSARYVASVFEGALLLAAADMRDGLRTLPALEVVDTYRSQRTVAARVPTAR